MSVPGSLAGLVDRAQGGPIYVASAVVAAPPFTDEITDLLRRKRPDAVFINGRGRYSSSAAWRARWPQERERYGGGIVLTVAEPLDDGETPTGAGIPGCHSIGFGVTSEIADFVALGRPVLWLPYFSGEYRLVARFSIEAMEWFSMGRFARLFPSGDAEPLAPTIGSLPFLDAPRSVDQPRTHEV